MSSLTKLAAPLARTWTRHQLAKPAVAAIQKRGRADEAASSSFDSPFHRSGGTQRETTNIPSFGKYKSGNSEVGNRVFQYFMVGGLGAITAMGAKATVQGKRSIFSSDAKDQTHQNADTPLQTSLSICLLPPMSWPKQKLRLT